MITNVQERCNIGAVPVEWVSLAKLTHYLYQRLAFRHAGTRAFRQTFIAAAMNFRIELTHYCCPG